MHAGSSSPKSTAVRTGFALLLFLLAVSPATSQAEDAGSSADADGEDALAAEAAKETADAYYTELAMMLGRLQAGYELYRIGDRADGGRHFVALAEQHLPVVREALEARDLDLLIRRIEQLAAEAGRSNSWIEVQDLHEASRMSMQHALSRVDPSTREDPVFKVEIVVALAREAVRSYEAALDGGEFVRPEAYQAAYGYISYGNLLLERNAGLLAQADDEVHESFIERYEALMEAWPSVRIPASQRIAPEDLRERLAALEAAAERF